MPDIFISYFTEERIRADALAAALRARDVTCFVDHDEVRFGDPLEPRLLREVARSAAMVVLASGDPAERPWVAKEIARARELGLRIMFVQLPGGSIDPKIRFEDARKTWLDPARVPHDLVNQIVRAVRPHVCVVPGYSGRADMLAAAMEGFRLWNECPLTRQDPLRAQHWYADELAHRVGFRVVFFIDFYDATHEPQTYLSMINDIRRRPARLMKPMFELLQGPGDDASHIPKELARCFRAPAVPTAASMEREYRRIIQEWHDKPRSSPSRT